jgi:hypothetical protein
VDISVYPSKLIIFIIIYFNLQINVRIVKKGWSSINYIYYLTYDSTYQ